VDSDLIKPNITFNLILNFRDLSWNEISNVSRMTFTGLKGLIILLINKNSLASIEDASFTNLTHLKTLWEEHVLDSRYDGFIPSSTHIMLYFLISKSITKGHWKVNLGGLETGTLLFEYVSFANKRRMNALVLGPSDLPFAFLRWAINCHYF